MCPYSVVDWEIKLRKEKKKLKGIHNTVLDCVENQQTPDRIRPEDGCKAELQSSRSDSLNLKKK